MTDKELRKLNRHDLLQMMLEQGRELEELKKQLGETQTDLEQSDMTCERLKRRLDDKDKQISKLKSRLDKKDVQIHDLRDMIERWRKFRQIELTEAGSIAEAALRLNGIFDVAQKAADQYLYNIKLLHEGQDEESMIRAADEKLLSAIDADIIADKEENRQLEEEYRKTALRLDGIFDAAQKAADQYLYNVELLHEAQDEDGAANVREADEGLYRI